MYDANRVLRRLRLVIVVLCVYDICLLTLLNCIAIYYSLTKSKKSGKIMPTLSGLQMRNLTDKV